jgi:uncharacterized membrane protein YgcG
MAETKTHDNYYGNEDQISFYYGKSTYTKPAPPVVSSIPVGMEYRETDTGATFTWDGDTWQPYGFGGGSGSSSSGGTSVYWGANQW